MAQKRMIDKKISVSEQIANLPLEAQIIFTWGIPHADDIGLLPASQRTLKATIVPMADWSLAKFGEYIKAIEKQGLWKLVEYKGEQFYFVVKFQSHQTLKKDRQPQTLLPVTLDKDPKTSWNIVSEVLDTLGIQLEDNVFQMVSEVKGSEVKGSEVKKKVASLFEIFWKEYPNKTAKKKALESWMRIFGKVSEVDDMARVIIEGLERAKKSQQWAKDGGKFIPHPTTWLNQERWGDEGVVGITQQNKTHKI